MPEPAEPLIVLVECTQCGWSGPEGQSTMAKEFGMCPWCFSRTRPQSLTPPPLEDLPKPIELHILLTPNQIRCLREMVAYDKKATLQEWVVYEMRAQWVVFCEGYCTETPEETWDT